MQSAKYRDGCPRGTKRDLLCSPGEQTDGSCCVPSTSLPDADYSDQQAASESIPSIGYEATVDSPPINIDREPVDPDLGEHVDGEVRFAATDGGVVDERAAIARAVDRQVLTGMVCGNVVGEDLPDWEVYTAVAAASQATIERVLEGDADA